MTVFCDVAPACCLLITLMMTASTSEAWVNFYQTTRNIPEDSHLHTRPRENLKSSNTCCSYSCIGTFESLCIIFWSSNTFVTFRNFLLYMVRVVTSACNPQAGWPCFFGSLRLHIQHICSHHLENSHLKDRETDMSIMLKLGGYVVKMSGGWIWLVIVSKWREWYCRLWAFEFCRYCVSYLVVNNK
jgi:hypothetical protein